MDKLITITIELAKKTNTNQAMFVLDACQKFARSLEGKTSRNILPIKISASWSVPL